MVRPLVTLALILSTTGIVLAAPSPAPSGGMMMHHTMASPKPKKTAMPHSMSMKHTASPSPKPKM